MTPRIDPDLWRLWQFAQKAWAQATLHSYPICLSTPESQFDFYFSRPGYRD